MSDEKIGVPGVSLMQRDTNTAIIRVGWESMSTPNRIFEYDIMSRYYGAKPNDIFRIVRDNTSSGKGIDYRLVIPGKYELIF